MDILEGDMIVFRRTNDVGCANGRDSNTRLRFCVTCVRSLRTGTGLLKTRPDNLTARANHSIELGSQENTNATPSQSYDIATAYDTTGASVDAIARPQKRSHSVSDDLRRAVKRKLSEPVPSAGATYSDDEELTESFDEVSDEEDLDTIEPYLLRLDGAHDSTTEEAATASEPLLDSQGCVTHDMVRSAAVNLGHGTTRVVRATSGRAVNSASRTCTPDNRAACAAASLPPAGRRDHEGAASTSAVSSPRVNQRVSGARVISQLPYQLPELWCVCQQENDGSRMIRCDNEYCSVAWYHLECLGFNETDVPPDWLCPQCAPSNDESAKWWYVQLANKEVIDKLLGKPVHDNPYGLASMPRIPVIGDYSWSRGPPPVLSAGDEVELRLGMPSETTEEVQAQAEDLTDMENGLCAMRWDSVVDEDEESQMDVAESDDEVDDQDSELSPASDDDADGSHDNEHTQIVQVVAKSDSAPQNSTVERSQMSRGFTGEQREILENWFDRYTDGPPTSKDRVEGATELEEKTGLARIKIQGWMYRTIKAATTKGRWRE